jgi:hypothetical protein
VSAHSQGSADVVCRAKETSRQCKSADTAPVSAAAPKPRRASRGSDPTPPAASAPGTSAGDDLAPAAGAVAVAVGATGAAVSATERGNPMSTLAKHIATLPGRAADNLIRSVGLTSSSSGAPADPGRPGLIVLLVNAAVPLLAMLTILALVLKARRRRVSHIVAYVPRHRRKQNLPSASSRTR